jgi:sulfide:quinone oxidoreductase
VAAYGRVRGVDRVWAVGDMTTRPLRQGGLATQQAEVAAADIAAQVAGSDVEVPPYQPTLRGMLLTGSEPLYLERDPRAPVRSTASSERFGRPAQKIAGNRLGPYLESAPTRS